MGKKSPLDLETLFRVPYVEPEGEFDLSPDGSKLHSLGIPVGSGKFSSYL
jgi:hypothetical protein